MITSGGKRNPEKLDLDADTRRGRRRINQACPILFSTDATGQFGRRVVPQVMQMGVDPGSLCHSAVSLRD